MRRNGIWDRRNKLGVKKGYTKQQKERCLSVPIVSLWRRMNSFRLLFNNFCEAGRAVCCAVCRKRSSSRSSSIVRRVCCRVSGKTYLLILLQLLCKFQLFPVGSASGLLGGNQAVILVPGLQRLAVVRVPGLHLFFNRCCGRYHHGWQNAVSSGWRGLCVKGLVGDDLAVTPMRGQREGGAMLFSVPELVVAESVA